MSIVSPIGTKKKSILDFKTALMSKLFVICWIMQAQNVPLLLLSHVLLCFKLQHIGLLATVDAVRLQQDQMNCRYSSTVAADTLSLLCFFVSFGGTTSKHVIAAALLFEDHFAINHFAHCIAVQKKYLVLLSWLGLLEMFVLKIKTWVNWVHWTFILFVHVALCSCYLRLNNVQSHELSSLCLQKSLHLWKYLIIPWSNQLNLNIWSMYESYYF